MVFKFVYFVDIIKGYQSKKFQCFELSGSSFTEELQKYNDDDIMTSFHILRIRNFNILRIYL